MNAFIRMGMLLGWLFFAGSCQGQPANIAKPTEPMPIHIERFDQALLEMIEAGDTAMGKPSGSCSTLTLTSWKL